MNKKQSLNPNWVTGFVDGEGCFLINIFLRKAIQKWEIRPCFQIRLHSRDLDVLKQIKSFFKGVGNIYIYESEIVYKVQKREDLINVIIPHFDKYSLLTEKQNDFTIFKNILTMVTCFLFSSTDMIKILELKASLNRGLSNKIQELFPDLSIIKRPISKSIYTIDPNWFAGLFSAEGCFYIKLEKSSKYNSINSVRLRIEIGQHSRDKILINNFVNFLCCGYTYNNNNFTSYSVSKFEDIYTKILPFFKQYKIIGTKSLDFKDFCEVAELIKNKVHLTEWGLNKIVSIKFGMNKGRYL